MLFCNFNNTFKIEVDSTGVPMLNTPNDMKKYILFDFVKKFDSDLDPESDPELLVKSGRSGSENVFPDPTHWFFKSTRFFLRWDETHRQQ